jgi:hypothetical protein
MMQGVNQMYNQTAEQTVSEKLLNKQGFRFSNWISARPDANNEPQDDKGIIIMIRKSWQGQQNRNSKFCREYREIEPNGDIIGDAERSF